MQFYNFQSEGIPFRVQKIWNPIRREIEMKSRGSAATGNRTRVGKYELGRTLGEGTFAKVKFATNTETGENVAIKILDKENVLKHKMIVQVSIIL